MSLPRLLSSSLVIAAGLALGACTCPLAGGKCPLRSATATPAKVQPADAFSGHWTGTWQSAVTGHHGPLACDFTKVDAKHYDARFKASWGMLSGKFDVVFNTQRHGHELRFQGQKDLGKLYGGVYRYDGKVTPDRFFSTYKAADDHGTFTMHR